MKLKLSLILMACMLMLNMNTSLGTNTSMQKPKQERQFNEGFKDSYSNRKYNYEGRKVVKPPSSKSGEAPKYSEDKPYVKEENDANDFSFGFRSFNWLFILILILAVGYLAYTLLNDGSSKLFSKRNHKKLSTHSEITAENIEYTDIKILIAKAENTDDYRLAIRYYYLLVLKQLSLKNFIKYEDDKTNADYMNAIASQKFSKSFAYTSYLYSYTWYGEFTLDQEEYHLAKDRFVQLINEVNS